MAARPCYEPIGHYRTPKTQSLNEVKNMVEQWKMVEPNNDVQKFGEEIKRDVLKGLAKLHQLQHENECFKSLGSDKKLLNPRCLPLVHQAMELNHTCLLYTSPSPRDRG